MLFRCVQFSALFLSALAGSARADFYWLTVTDRRQQAEVVINGFPLKGFPGTNTQTLSTLLEPYVIAGDNLLLIRSTDNDTNRVLNDFNLIETRIDYGSNTVSSRWLTCDLTRESLLVDSNLVERISFLTTNREYQIRGRLNTNSTRLEVNSANDVATYRFLPAAGTNLIQLTVTLPLARLSSLPWTGATPALTDADRTQITALVRSMHEALTTTNYTTFFQITEAKNQRLAQAAGQTLAERQAEAQAFLDGIRGQSGFEFQPLNTTAFVFETYPDVNLVQVLVNGGGPIEATATAFNFKIAVFVSKLGGVWGVVD